VAISEYRREIITSGCVDCALQPGCGGIERHVLDLFGCHDRCRTKCANSSCDLTCPNNQELFAARWAEVGGLLSFPCPAFLPVSTADFPLYVPLIRPGIIRTRPLNSVFVGLSLYEVLRALKKRAGLRRDEWNRFSTEARSQG
jgi:hypothetical protein